MDIIYIDISPIIEGTPSSEDITIPGELIIRYFIQYLDFDSYEEQLAFIKSVQRERNINNILKE